MLNVHMLGQKGFESAVHFVKSPCFCVKRKVWKPFVMLMLGMGRPEMFFWVMSGAINFLEKGEENQC